MPNTLRDLKRWLQDNWQGNALLGGTPPQTVDEAVRALGFDPNADRLTLLPHYNEQDGLVAPDLLYQIARAAVSPGVAAHGGEVSPRDALNFAGNVTLGSYGASRLAPPTGEGATVGMAAADAKPKTESPLKNFGKKHAREAARKSRVAKQAAAETTVGRQKGAGTRAKVAPDTYRKMYEEKGLDAVLAAGRRGEHLKPNPDGGWVGAPRSVQTGPQLGHMRRQLDQQLAEGADALHYADPERMGTWYDRAKEAQALSNEPYQLPRSLEATAVYSAGKSPEGELGMAIKHHNANALMTGEIPYTAKAAETLNSAIAENRPASLGFKIGEYGPKKNNPAVVESSPFGVNDFRMAQTFGYTDPTGQPWKAGVSAQMHPFMDMETAMAVDRANQAAVGEKTNWTGATVQEVPWVYGKAQDLYARGKKGRFSGGERGQINALREANNTIADYMPKHTLSATYEYAPGAHTGHRADILNAPYNERLRYGDIGRWDVPAPEGPQTMPGGVVGAGRRDALYSAVGFRQLPAVESVGNYLNSTGARETNPLTIARPLMDFQNEAKTGNALTLNPATRETVRGVERFRGAIDAQEVSAVNMPVTMNAKRGKGHVLLDRGRPPSAAELRDVIDSLAGTGLEGAVSATDRGIMIFTGAEKHPKAARKLVQERISKLEKALPGSRGRKAANEGVYERVMSSADQAGKGIATGRVLGQLGRRTPEAAALNLSENEAVRRIIRQKIERDAGNPNTRQDIQRMREFFASEDWSRVVALIRKGIKPAAAMAALGYSMQGMAESDLQEAAK